MERDLGAESFCILYDPYPSPTSNCSTHLHLVFSVFNSVFIDTMPSSSTQILLVCAKFKFNNEYIGVNYLWSIQTY